MAKCQVNNILRTLIAGVATNPDLLQNVNTSQKIPVLKNKLANANFVKTHATDPEAIYKGTLSKKAFAATLIQGDLANIGKNYLGKLKQLGEILIQYGLKKNQKLSTEERRLIELFLENPVDASAREVENRVTYLTKWSLPNPPMQ